MHKGQANAPFSRLALAALLVPLPVLAQPICGARDVIAGHLAAKYGEQPAFGGLASDGVVLELFVSRLGSWTIIATRPDGVACVVASGVAGVVHPQGDPI